jgi:hypothetical protein
VYITFVSSKLIYSTEKGLYIYTFYDTHNKYKTLYFLNHKDFRDYLNQAQAQAQAQAQDNLQIVHAALVTDTDYLVDLTDRIKSFSYYFKDPSTIPWSKILSEVQHTRDINLKMYIQSTHTKGNAIQHSERTFECN